jgi:hypothetical protein
MRYIEILTEKVIGNLAIGYHRTKSLDVINSIVSNGFSPGNGDTYGKGVYMTYDLQSQLNPNMLKYGNYIIRNKINLNKYLIFDTDIAKLVYNNNFSLNDQLKLLQYNPSQIKKIMDIANNVYEYKADIAQPVYTADIAQPISELINKFTNGLVFTGRQDGKVIVAYNILSITPFGYADVPTPDTEIIWTKIKANIPKEEIQNIDYNKLSKKFPDNELYKQLAAVQKDGNAISYIKNPSEQVQIAAVQQNGFAIRCIKNPSEQVQLAAVQQDGYAITYIKNPSEQVQLAAVQQNGFAILFIQNPSEQVQLAAVQQNGYAIQYIKNPSEQVQLAAVKQDGNAIIYIDNPSEKLKQLAKRK